MEFECPNPFPRIRYCPEGITIDAAICYMGYIQLHCLTEIVPPMQVFYMHPGDPGWHFVSPCSLESFLTIPQQLDAWREDPALGVDYIHSYFKGHVARHLENMAKYGPSKINAYFGLPG